MYDIVGTCKPLNNSHSRTPLKSAKNEYLKITTDKATSILIQEALLYY